MKKEEKNTNVKLRLCFPGKWWGRREDPIILAVHGWQDNACSWDPLAEKMPPKYSILAIDLPGNGQSSHLPPFHRYTYAEAPFFVKRVTNYLNRKVHLLGHSGGSAACLIYSATYPDDVASFFAVDFLGYCYKNESGKMLDLAKIIDAHINLALKDPRTPKRYSWEQIRDHWIAATEGSLTPETVEILMKGGVYRLPDSTVVLTRDVRARLNDMTVLISDEHLRKIVNEVKTPTCVVRGKGSPFFFDRGIKNIPDILDILKSNCSVFEFHEIDGNHHVHMDKPEEVAELYLSFLDKVNNSL